MINEIRNDIHRAVRMVAEVEIIIGKREGETELVNKLIDAQNLLTYCKSRLENAVVPPCKVGDTVYCLIRGLEEPLEGKVQDIAIKKSAVIIRCAPKGYFGISYVAEEIGKRLFFTREEAEKTLAERSEKND